MILSREGAATLNKVYEIASLAFGRKKERENQKKKKSKRLLVLLLILKFHNAF